MAMIRTNPNGEIDVLTQILSVIAVGWTVICALSLAWSTHLFIADGAWVSRGPLTWGYAVVWGIGNGFFFLTYLRSEAHIKQKRQAEAALTISEEKFRGLYDTSPVGFVSVDAGDGTVKQCNPVFARILGFDPNDLLAKPVSGFCTAGSVENPNAEDAVALFLCAVAFTDVDVRLRSKDGTPVWVSLSGNPVFDENGLLVECRHTAIPIDSRKAAEEALRESEQRYRLLFDESVAGCALHEMICDDAGNPVDYRFLEVNPAFERLTGLQRENVVGRTILEVMPGIEAWWIQTYGEVVRTGDLKHFENYSQELDRHFEVLAFRPRDGQFATTFSDITERKRAEEKFRKVHDDLETRVVERTSDLEREIAERRFVETALKEARDFLEQRVFDQTRELRDEISERKRIEHALTESREQFNTVINNSPASIHVKDCDGRFTMANDEFSRRYGLTLDDVRGKRSRDVFPRDVADLTDIHDKIVLKTGTTCEFEVRFPKDDGSVYSLLVTKFPVRQPDGTVLGIGTISSDVTSRRRAEEALRRSQRMEAIGQLTGGVAHDFNNLLGIVIGNLDFIDETCGDNELLSKRVQGALQAAWRGADLTKRLLSFSRREATCIESTNVSDSVSSMQDMLARTLTEKIKLETKLAQDVWHTEIDEGDLEDAIINLAINARDAMAKGGILRIETSNIVLEKGYAEQFLHVDAGEYVSIVVTDTGSGIPAETRDRVFEPFFTTKEAGHGTGLGLSIVYGFVQRSKGIIGIDSEPGRGTTVWMYFPRAANPVEKIVPPGKGDRDLPTGNEMVLVVDDERELRRIAETYLSKLGYRTLGANDAKEARVILEGETAVDMLFSDIVMPGGTSGEELAEIAVQLRPGIKVLLTTGFSRDSSECGAETKSAWVVLAKPFSHAELASTVREILDRPSKVLAKDLG